MSRQIQKKETRQRLLDAAFQVICEKGIVETRVSDIAQAAGVSHGALFVHFASLENLISEAVETCGQRIALRTHELASQSTGLEGLLRAHLAGINEYEPFYTRLVIESRLLPQAARDAWIGIQSAISFHFSRIVTREWPRADTALLFNTWMGLVHYYLINGDLFAPEGHVISRYTETLVAFYIKLTAGMTGEAKKEG
jgi:AcrR family transcriptional regulator